MHDEDFWTVCAMCHGSGEEFEAGVSDCPACDGLGLAAMIPEFADDE